MLSGSLPDQAALHGLLERIRDLNIILISVTVAVQLPSIPKRNNEVETLKIYFRKSWMHKSKTSILYGTRINS